MNKPVFISIDVETGGFGADKSLLTAYLSILDQDLNKIDGLYLCCKPNDGIYHVTGSAMAVNGINLIEHDKIAQTYKDCRTILYKFLDKNRGDKHLIPLGQNIRFDINKVTECLISKGSWDEFVSHRVIDVGVIAGFAIQLGLLPSDLNAGLQAMASYFHVGEQPDFGHDARQDVWLSIEVYKKLLHLFKGRLNLI